MSKAILKVGYSIALVMDSDKAMALFKLLTDETLYKLDVKYTKDETTDKSAPIKYLEPYNEAISIIGTTETDYALWKLAGTSNE